MSLLKNRQYLLFLAVMLLFAVASSLYRGVLDNYLAESLAVSKSGRGIVEFFRELPGLLLVFILALFYRLPEQGIIRIGFIIALAGIVGVLLAGSSFIVSVLFITILSAGQHIVMPVRTSIVVHSVAKGREGSALGLMRSLLSIGQVIGFFGIPVLFAALYGTTETTSHDEGYRITFYIVIGLVAVALLLAFLLRGGTERISRQRIYFHRKYMKYYILQNFYGARKQVFLTFGPYVLILKYGATPSVIATLLGICGVITIFTNPLIGKLIDRVGYKAVMVGDTVVLFFVCLAYGFAHHLFPLDTAFYFIYVIFIIDSIISHASMAASIYVKELSDSRDEVTATITTGLSLDHLISIFVALIGGFVWELFGIELLFSLAAAMAVMNSLIALTIRKRQPLA